ncbi:hypothetical protein SAMN05216390_11761 [Lachnospiraceae bacterium KH1T2]|nr:hypothetical protein SAMN05216390_11761 [Lachnospiraceae bacterium KH1T2]
MMMKYDIQLDQAFSACSEGDFATGEKVVNAIINTYGCIERAVHLLLCIYSCTGQSEKAISLLRRLKKESIWLNPIEMENDNDLDTLRNLDEFKTLLKFSWNSYNCASKNAQAQIYTMGENKDTVAPIYFFHGRGAKLTEFSEDFQDIFNLRQVYYVQSEQVYSRERYCWDDEHLSILQVGDVLDHSSELHKLISGVSQGARILIDAFTQGIIKNDLLLFIPAVSESSIDKVRNSNIDYEGDITIISGDRDGCFPASMELADVLAKKGFNIKCHVIKGMGHYILPQEIKRKMILKEL